MQQRKNSAIQDNYVGQQRKNVAIQDDYVVH